MTHFLQITDHSRDFIAGVIDDAIRLRDELQREGRNAPVLERRTLAMVFEKPSLRTRVSFEAGMTQLGGHAINLQPAEIGVNTREPARDISRVLGGMVDGIMGRVFSHQTLLDLAEFSPVPLINGLCDRAHPVQALADLLTIRDAFGDLDALAGRRVVYIGDANNVMRSLAATCGMFDMSFVACCPPGYAATEPDLARLEGQVPQLDYTAESDPKQAAAGADVLYTDTWVSMGQEEEKQQRVEAFRSFTIDADLLSLAAPEAIVLHCLPAYRGLEISEEVLEGPRSRVFAQAHNRLHAQKGLLVKLLGPA